MATKAFKRIQRPHALTAQEAAHDRELRHKIQKEFPPLEGKPVSAVLSDPLREAISQSRKSVRRLAKEAEVSAIVLQQFLDGERDLRLATAERLVQILELKLVAA